MHKETERDLELRSLLFSLCHGDFAAGDGSLGVSCNTTPPSVSVLAAHAHIHTPLSFTVNALGRLEKEKCLLHYGSYAYNLFSLALRWRIHGSNFFFLHESHFFHEQEKLTGKEISSPSPVFRGIVQWLPFSHSFSFAATQADDPPLMSITCLTFL